VNDPEESVISGKIDSVNYRRAKFYSGKIKSALAARKPEEEVVPAIIALGLHAGHALGRYPRHAEFQAWFNEAESCRQKLTPQNLAAYDLESPFIAGDSALSSNLAK